MLLALLLGLLTGCQVIPEDDRLIPYQPAEGNRTALIMEFSGFRCVNCPNAAALAHDLIEQYPGKVVVVELHPASNSFTNTNNSNYDYTSPAAEVYYKAFGGTATTPFPTGIINLFGASDGSNFTDYQNWAGLCVSALAQQTPVTLSQTVSVDTTTRELILRPALESISLQTEGVKYVAWLTEDSIIGPQQMPDGTTEREYAHNHLLRDTLTAAWGAPIEVPANSSAEVPEIRYTVPEKVNLQHANIVGLVVRNDEVVYAVETKISE